MSPRWRRDAHHRLRGRNQKIFTIVAKGQPHIFSAARLVALPKVGEVLDVEYTDAGTGGPLESINLNSSRSNVY